MNNFEYAESLMAAASSAGFGVVTDPQMEISPEAARLLPPDAPAVGVEVAGDILAVVTDRMPTPGEVRDLQKLAGMPVYISIAPPEVYEVIKNRLESLNETAGAPYSIGSILVEAVRVQASDVHLSVGQPPVLKVNGELEIFEKAGILSARDMESAAKWIAGEAFSRFAGDLDCAVSYANSRWRVNIYSQRGSLALAIRRISDEIPRADKLGLPDSVRRLAALNSGLVLFCGPTGSGKSTSMASLVDRINRTRKCHIVTIEDPIEYVHVNREALVHQREVGPDTKDFATALRASLRQDPDIILVGELRDQETMQMALTAAETGHLVLATVHASSASEVFQRVVSVFPADQQDQVRTQLSLSLKAIIAQLLLPSSNGSRVLASEVLINTKGISTIIREGRIHEIPSAISSGRSEGMHSFDFSLAQLVGARKISQDVALAHVEDKASFTQFLSKVSRPDDYSFLDGYSS